MLQYGALDINYEHPDQTIHSAGTGQDLQFGFNLGLAYEIDAFTIGAVYKSQIDMQYKDVMSNAISAFSATGAYENEKLSSPEEMGVGVSYKINEHTIALDYKHIAWSKAKGYEDFEWEDQNVIALGYEYAADGWAARVGYNYADSPIKEQTNATPNSAGLNGTTVNTFNLLGFPAIVTSHVTTGGTYAINKLICVDLALVYALEAKNSYRNFAAQDITTKHSQTSVSAQINYAF